MGAALIVGLCATISNRDSVAAPQTGKLATPARSKPSSADGGVRHP